MEFKFNNWILFVAVLVHYVTFYVVTSESASVSPQIPVLGRAPGHVLGRGSRSARVLIEAYIELQCKDSAAAWPVLQKVALHYDPQDVAVIIHQMPLPQHRNAFLLTEGYYQVADRSPYRIQDYVTMCLQNVELFSDEQNPTWGEDKFTSLLSSTQESHTGIPAHEFTAGIHRYRNITKATWKHGVTRGVAGTPWYFINGVNIGTHPSDVIEYTTWLKMLDHLLQISDKEIWSHSVNLQDVFPPVVKETKVSIATHEVNDSSAAASHVKPSNGVSMKCRSAKKWKKYLQHLLNRGYYLVKYEKK